MRILSIFPSILLFKTEFVPTKKKNSSYGQNPKNPLRGAPGMLMDRIHEVNALLEASKLKTVKRNPGNSGKEPVIS